MPSPCVFDEANHSYQPLLAGRCSETRSILVTLDVVHLLRREVVEY